MSKTAISQVWRIEGGEARARRKPDKLYLILLKIMRRKVLSDSGKPVEQASERPPSVIGKSIE
ncbi:MAG: hypothetical protein VR66_14915 [Peptococcaceae bacterium BRH_c23]|nr:MAG: hypothetical protein VR66_14915 [Peptococcaceae bacterium BRH_c23]KJS89367.1 MAG: hypothetical protein JL57_07795 [Desulfosporosinus sp. BICA1-9]HBW34785.1 hypothetical protein [Desulfosporosinus sp.]